VKRAFAVLLLVAFFAGPAASLRCLFACAPARPAEAASSCHASRADAAVVSGAEDCNGARTTAPAFVKRSDTPAPMFVPAPARYDDSAPARFPDAGRSDATLTTPPLSHLIVPLRI
jgi:hypothetical protein